MHHSIHYDDSKFDILTLQEAMGTHGYYVYRYRNKYFAYPQRGAYPGGLGIETLRIMRETNAISRQRKRMERILAKSMFRSFPQDDDDDDRLKFLEERLQNDVIIEWIYEIDLDRNIFHINGRPFFSLKCLPNEDDFLRYISDDRYGGVVCAPECLPNHKYSRPAPPVINRSDLTTYRSLTCTGTDVALNDLLSISDMLSPGQEVRISLLETMIGQCLIRVRPNVASIIHGLVLVSDHEKLTDEEWSTTFSLANFAFVPQIFNAPTSGSVGHPRLSRKEFTWVREDTVVCIATHLDNERCLQASMSRLIDAILEKDNPGDYFGVAFSIYHCAIVKVVKNAHETTFSHTGALQFLPSFTADSPSTPGITALAHLGNRIDPALFVRAMEISGMRGESSSKRQRGNKQQKGRKRRTVQKKSLTQGADNTRNISTLLLPELWREVALYLHLDGLLTFGLVSKLCREVASMILRHPHISGYRLVAVLKDRPRLLLYEHRFLRGALFSAMQADISTIMLVGFGEEEEVVNIPFVFQNDSSSFSLRFSADVQPDATREDEEHEEFDPEREGLYGSDAELNIEVEKSDAEFGYADYWYEDFF